MLMPKKTRLQKILSEKRKLEKKSLPSSEDSHIDQSTKYFFMADFKKSILLSIAVLVFEFALYFVSIKGYF